MKPSMTVVCVFLIVSNLTYSADRSTNRLADEEAVLSKALAFRARVIENKTGIKFDVIPKARLERLTFSRGQRAAGQYDVLRRDVLFSVVIWSELNIALKKPLRLASPDDVAVNDGFQRIADHELGHALADQVSRRNSNGTWFLPEYVTALRPPEALGLSVVSEGIGTWFELATRQTHTVYSEENFPEGTGDAHLYRASMDTIIYGGGYWLVRDILNRHGELGLIWIITHPLSLRQSSMRADAVAYRNTALNNLRASANPRP